MNSPAGIILPRPSRKLPEPRATARRPRGALLSGESHARVAHRLAIRSHRGDPAGEPGVRPIRDALGSLHQRGCAPGRARRGLHGVIEARSETGAKLAAAYCNRGHGLTEKRELDARARRSRRGDQDSIRPMRAPTTIAAASTRSRGDYDRAIADYGEAIRINPKFALAYNNRGDAWRHKGDLDRAIADFDEAIRLDPAFALAYGNRGDSWHQQKNFARAIEDYSAQIRIAPSLHRLYRARQRLSRQRAARACGRRLQRGDPARAERCARLAQSRPDPPVPGELQGRDRRLRQGAGIRSGGCVLVEQSRAGQDAPRATGRARLRTSARRWRCGPGCIPRPRPCDSSALAP